MNLFDSELEIAGGGSFGVDSFELLQLYNEGVSHIDPLELADSLNEGVSYAGAAGTHNNSEVLELPEMFDGNASDSPMHYENDLPVMNWGDVQASQKQQPAQRPSDDAAPLDLMEMF